MITIYKKGSFESAHLLKGHPKCGKLHGHSYRYEVWISTERLNTAYNFVLDFQDISNYFKQYDHSDKVINISCETMVQEAVEHFNKLLEGSRKIKVIIWETANSYGQCEKSFED